MVYAFFSYLSKDGFQKGERERSSRWREGKRMENVEREAFPKEKEKERRGTNHKDKREREYSAMVRYRERKRTCQRVAWLLVSVQFGIAVRLPKRGTVVLYIIQHTITQS